MPPAYSTSPIRSIHAVLATVVVIDQVNKTDLIVHFGSHFFLKDLPCGLGDFLLIGMLMNDELHFQFLLATFINLDLRDGVIERGIEFIDKPIEERRVEPIPGVRQDVVGVLALDVADHVAFGAIGRTSKLDIGNVLHLVADERKLSHLQARDDHFRFAVFIRCGFDVRHVGENLQTAFGFMCDFAKFPTEP